MKNGILFIYGNGKRPLQHACKHAYIHIDVHMNAKWIQTNILFVKHRPKELGIGFICVLPLFHPLSLAHHSRAYKKARKNCFLATACQATFTKYKWWLAFSSVNKICIVIGVWIFKTQENRDKHTHGEREASVNDCRGYVCIAFVINRVGFSHRSPSLQKQINERTKIQAWLCFESNLCIAFTSEK